MDYLKLFQTHEEYEAFVSGGTMVKPNVSHCVQENEVHYNSLYDPYNGYAYVDLGLTSGTKWAKMNVGASSETENGLYFAWGETQGYTADQVGTTDGKKAFNWADYKFSINGSSSNLSKYNATDNKTHLELTDDAAAANMGGDWRMPNRAQCIELFKETKNGFVTNAGAFTQYAWSDNDGYSIPTETTANITWSTAGHIFFKNNYASVTDAISANDYLFIPAAGDCSGGGVFGVGEWGSVWSSFLGADDVISAWYFYFDDYEAGVGLSSRCCGQSVRGVVGQMDETTPDEGGGE